jgi:hypothetical protein
MHMQHALLSLGEGLSESALNDLRLVFYLQIE